MHALTHALMHALMHALVHARLHKRLVTKKPNWKNTYFWSFNFESWEIFRSRWYCTNADYLFDLFEISSCLCSFRHFRRLVLDHHDLLLAAEEEPELVDHHLDDVFQVRPHGLELAEVAELVLKQGGPPADGQVLAVHAIVLAHLSHPEKIRWYFKCGKWQLAPTGKALRKDLNMNILSF